MSQPAVTGTGPAPAATPPLSWPHVERRRKPRSNRELYIDAFRGLMALVMVQGHVFDTLLRADIRADDLYRFQQIFHGSTAPGFLFASGFVAGLPRSPLSFKASFRRARRLLFVLGLGYALNLPYLSLWKTMNSASHAELALGLGCHALHVIAVTQLFVLLLQWLVGRHWVRVAGALALVIMAVTPLVWDSGLSFRLPLALGAYLDQRAAPSQFPVFPFSSFVLAGTAAGAALGRQDARVRWKRALRWGLALLVGGTVVALAVRGRTDFWLTSPGYTLMRLGALMLLLRGVEALALRRAPGLRALALFGHETLLVYVFHLYFLYGGVFTEAPLGSLVGRLSLGAAFATLAAMVAVLLGMAWAWHRVKIKAPHEATLLLVFLATMFVYEFLRRPW
ncbi:MAG TPA: heparan-alpha-glucosaminide N-acetyltransferase domain-containing protein [Vicinamibacteria bacterium]|nr:heparan-alpha-glucosaminide N-acetyltransferase domain-containing protein [Vicinamibacteria bacterium]